MSNSIYTGVFTSHQVLPSAQLDAMVLAINNHDHGTEANGGNPLNFNAITLASIAPILTLIYPVGCTYTETTGVNPGTTFGIGTWVAFAQGQVMIGAGTGTDINSYSQTFTAGATGGEYIHALILNELPTIRMGQGANNYITLNYNTSGPSVDIGVGYQNVGTNTPHNNTQTYITVYIWKRTA